MVTITSLKKLITDNSNKLKYSLSQTLNELIIEILMTKINKS
jgi:hypothetical protein